MRHAPLTILICSVLLGGCAAGGGQPPHVLSGEASVDSIVGRAAQAAAAGDDLAAVILYRQAISQAPSAELWYRLGVAHSHAGDSADALLAFHQALSLDPEHVPALQHLALHFTARDRGADARPYLDRLLAVAPDNWRAHNALGVLADLEGRHDSAAVHFAAAIEREPQSAMLWNNLGYSYYLAGDDAAARRAIDTALQLQPDHTAGRHNLALLLARQQRYDEALRVMQTSRSDAQAYADIGYLAFRLGDLDRAEALLSEAIRRSSTYNRQAHQHLAAVREARTAAVSGG